jgi:hypothetical protein
MEPIAVTSREGRSVKRAPDRLSLAQKAVTAARIWWSFATVARGTRRHPLPAFVGRYGRPKRASSMRADPRRLGRMVFQVLRLGPWRARCLHTSLVLLRLLKQQGDPAELVIGLPLEPRDKDAHAWIEIDGVDVGPPPGRGRHQELARYR